MTAADRQAGQLGEGATVASCPDPRGPLVDRPDFLEGRLEALREMRTKVGEALYNARLEVSLALAGEMDAGAANEAYEGLMAASCGALDHLDDEIVHARWKLSAARRREARAAPLTAPDTSAEVQGDG